MSGNNNSDNSDNGIPQVAVQWAPKPTSGIPSNCPPGFEYLLQVDQFFVKQQTELLEAFTGFETGNKYNVRGNV